MSDYEPHRIVSLAQYEEDKSYRLAIDDLCLDREYYVRTKITPKPQAFAVDCLSVVTKIIPVNNYFDISYQLLRGDRPDTPPRNPNAFSDGLLFHSILTNSSIDYFGMDVHEVGYFHSAIDEDDMALLGLGVWVKKSKRRPILV